MKLFSKEVDKKLFAQYPKGANLENQNVVTKIFNPYGAGRWYLLNSDPADPDYIWAIVEMRGEVEMGSVSRRELESIRIRPFGLPLERDLYFSPVNAAELFQGLRQGKFYKSGGWIEGEENKAMLLNQAEGFEHHAEELEDAAKKADHVPAWVVAKSERASTDLSDITHYLDGENEQKREEIEGEEMAHGGEVKWQNAQLGDSALVVSENKMGVIIKPYGRKFHLKFVDGTEKTYDASELRFFGDVDDFDRGGMMEREGKIYKIQVKDSDDLQPKWQDDTFYTGGKKYLSYSEAQKAVKKLQGDTAYYSKEFKVVEDKEKMAKGGKVTFDDKVASVKKSLLKRKKVPKAVQKDYGKTFSPKEAEDSAKRIVGAMTAKERMMKSLKRRKK